MPYLSTAARVSPPPAIENASEAAMARASTSVPLPNASNSRSEEHTSELQSRENLVCRLLLEKKKKTEIVKGDAGLGTHALLIRDHRHCAHLVVAFAVLRLARHAARAAIDDHRRPVRVAETVR